MIECVVIMSTSAHPAAYLAARECGREAHVLMDRPSQHAIEHGKAIASAMWAADFVAKQPAAKAGSKRKMLDELQAMFFCSFFERPRKSFDTHYRIYADMFKFIHPQFVERCRYFCFWSIPHIPTWFQTARSQVH